MEVSERHGLIANNVWMGVTKALQNEIVDFWKSNDLLSPKVDAPDRALEAVYTVRSQGKIVGITTAGLVRFKQLNSNLFYLFRMAVLPAFRIPGIESKLLVDTRDTLETYAATQTENKCIGLLTFVESPKLIASRNEAVWPASKMVFIGSDKQGRHIRVYYFKGVRV
ncbi:MAG TPA: hypothetical protein VK508_04295 [Cyclobacteriaceae bacterium]|nr:hypothetical protein [Cyclobacteriaceae bacterium]